MANNSMLRGFVPVSPDGQNVPTVTRAKKVSSADAMFIGSPVVIASGVCDTVADDTDGATMTGAIVGLFDSTGAAVETLAAAAAGTCVLSYLREQQYQAVVESTNYATTDAGTQEYQVTTEGSTASPYSDCMIGADSSTGPIIAGGLVKRPDNTAGVAKCEIYCKINPANYAEA